MYRVRALFKNARYYTNWQYQEESDARAKANEFYKAGAVEITLFKRRAKGRGRYTWDNVQQYSRQ